MTFRFAIPMLAFLAACAQAAPPTTIHVDPLVSDKNVRKVERSEIVQNPDGTVTVKAVLDYKDGSKGRCIFVLATKPTYATREPKLKSSTCEPLNEKAETE